VNGDGFHKEAIYSREQAIGNGGVIKLLPALELRGANTGYVVNILEKTLQDDQQDDPDQPGLGKTDDGSQQSIAKANQGRLIYHAVDYRTDNVNDENSSEEEQDIGNERRNGDVVRGEKRYELRSIHLRDEKACRKTEQVEKAENGAIAKTVEDEQDNCDDKKNIDQIKHRFDSSRQRCNRPKS
jgi:hypothetical protein